MKIRPVLADVFHADRHEEANGRFLQICARAQISMYRGYLLSTPVLTLLSLALYPQTVLNFTTITISFRNNDRSVTVTEWQSAHDQVWTEGLSTIYTKHELQCLYRHSICFSASSVDAGVFQWVLYCLILCLYCLILCLYCLILRLYCLILCLYCLILCLYCLILGLYCLILGLYCLILCIYCLILCLYCLILCLYCLILCLYCLILCSLTFFSFEEELLK